MQQGREHMWWQVMNEVSSSGSTYCFGFIKDKITWSVIKWGWAGLENSGLFPLSVAIFVNLIKTKWKLCMQKFL